MIRFNHSVIFSLKVIISAVILRKFLKYSVSSSYFQQPSGYARRVVSSFFLLYTCYSTIIFYIPLSAQFGPLMVKVKLMIFRDFINFLLLVSLVMIRSVNSEIDTSKPNEIARSLLQRLFSDIT